MRRRLIAVLLVIAAFPAVAGALPPRPPGPIKTLAALKELRTAKPLSMTGYSRDRLPHWIGQGNGCDTRKLVLIRDGSNVKVGPRCKIVSGSWFSFYDGLRFMSASRIDIDHIVPLATAWRSGAKRWTDAKRRDFANDLENSQPIAASAASNRSKSDQNPDAWKPPRRRAWCLYSRWWIQVKEPVAAEAR